MPPALADDSRQHAEEEAQAMERLASQLQELGCLPPCHHTELPATMALRLCVSPGADRTELVGRMLQLLVQPTPSEPLLMRLDSTITVSTGQDADSLSGEEHAAHCQAALLTMLGIPATPDQVRGSASYRDSLQFLQRLAGVLQRQQQLRTASPHLDSAAGVGGSSGSSSAPPPTPLQAALPVMGSPAKGGSAHVSGQQQQQLTGVVAVAAQHARLLEFVCDRLPALMAETGAPLFPSDISKACAPFSDQAQVLVRDRERFASGMRHGQQQLQASLQVLSEQVKLVSDQEWAQAHAECVLSAQRFALALNQFLETYQKELRVWCEASERPHTFGFGQQASSMLEVHAQLGDLLTALDTIKRMHSALTASTPPLEGYSKAEMLQLVAAQQQQQAQLAKQVDVLQRRANAIAATMAGMHGGQTAAAEGTPA